MYEISYINYTFSYFKQFEDCRVSKLSKTQKNCQKHDRQTEAATGPDLERLVPLKRQRHFRPRTENVNCGRQACE